MSEALKASAIQRFSPGDDVSGDAAVNNLEPTLSFGGGLPETFSGVRVDSQTPTPTPILQIQQNQPNTIDITTAPTTTPIVQIQQTQPITIDNGGTAEIRIASSQAVTFEGATGTLKLDDAQAFTGQVSGLTGSDALDLADVSYGANTTVSFSGNVNGGTLTVTNGSETAHIALLGDYLSSGWTLSSDGHGGTVVVDPQLPPGVTLQQIDGGPTYYASNGLTDAAAMGWDNPNFFAIGPFDSAYTSQTDVNTWSALGWNTDFGDGGVTLSLAASNGISVIEQNYTGSLPSNVVGLITMDEPSTFAQGVSTPLSTTANSIQDGRFWWMNNTWSWDAGYSLSGAPAPGTPASILSDLITTPDGTKRQVDINSIDMYWFAGSRDPSWNGYMLGSGGAGQQLYHLSSGMTADQAQRGSNYGDMIDIERGYVGDSKPIFAFVEDGDPFSGDTNGSSYITPPELNWATWSSLIHGARGVIYFDHSFSGPGSGNVGVENSYFQTVQPGQTISIYNQIKATDALVEQLAPVLNSPFALNYVTVKDNAPQDAGLPSYTFGSGVDLTQGGLEVMAKDYNGQFYIFADTRDSETRTNIPATFTIADPNATSVTVVGENRTIAVVNGVFTDTFATAATVHIYEVNDSSGPTISSIVESPASGHLNTGNTVSLTLDFSSAVTVAGGTPTLTLNDGGTATYASGSGSTALTFSYAVAAGQNTAALAATAVNLNGATVKNGAGNAADLSLTGLTQTGPYIGTVTPVITSIGELPASGDLNAGKTVTYTLNMSEAVTVAGGTPQLTLNDGGTATYTSGSGTSALTFGYTVAAGQNTPDLMVTAVNLNGASVTDSIGNAANLSLSGLTQGSPQVDTMAPAAPVISGDTVSVNTVALNGTAEANSTIAVFDNSTQLGTATTNSGGAWTYTTGALANGSQSFTATATDGAGNVSAASSALVMTLTAPVNLVTNGSFETDNFSGWTLGGNDTSGQMYINGQAESGSFAAALGSMGSDGTLNQTLQTTAGQQYTLSFWLANNGSGPNDITAKWNGASVLALTNAPAQGYTEYTFTVTATGSTSTLEFDARQDPSHWSLDNVSVTPVGTVAPTISSIAELPSSGDLNAGKTVTYTINISENVTVNTAGGTPTLALNDGGTATYVSGSGTNALTFSYTVAAGQNTPDLMVTAVNLNGGTIQDGAGNAANLSLTGLTQGSPQVDTTAPTVSSVVESPASGDLNAAKTVTLTLNMSENVTVNTTGGQPTLSLNDGTTATTPAARAPTH